MTVLMANVLLPSANTLELPLAGLPGSLQTIAKI